MDAEATFSPSDFVAVLNQTLEYAYTSVVIVGELANFRVSKGRWVYFDLKDETASVKFFGTVYGLPGPLEEGMMVRVVGQPRLSPQYGFSVSFQTIMPVGEGTLRRAADLLKRKLASEGLFDTERKRAIPYPPQRIGLVASEQSAAYRDFIKILDVRWSGVEIVLANVQVQGDAAPGQIVAALEHMNQHELVDAIVVTRGGGSADDLAAFSSEAVTRAVASSRVPTLVAIGHEVDVSLAELAADVRASTPSNAAELLTPDVKDVRAQLASVARQLDSLVVSRYSQELGLIQQYKTGLMNELKRASDYAQQSLLASKQLLLALSPELALKRGYALVKVDGKLVRSVHDAKPGGLLDITVSDGTLTARVQ